MSHGSAFFQWLSLAVTVLTAVTPFITESLPKPIGNPVRIKLTDLTPVNPIRDLNTFPGETTLELKFQDQVLNNISIGNVFLENVGVDPILPQDFYEPITVGVNPPWKIVSVLNEELANLYLKVVWERIDDQHYAAKPCLINPGDKVSARVYITNTDQKNTTLDNIKSPSLEWTTRVPRMKGFEKDDFSIDERDKDLFPLSVHIDGYGLLYVLIAGPVFFAATFYLSCANGLIIPTRKRTVLLVTAEALLGFAAAESIVTYIFPPLRVQLVGVEHNINLPFIILQAGVLVALFIAARLSARRIAQKSVHE